MSELRRALREAGGSWDSLLDEWQRGSFTRFCAFLCCDDSPHSNRVYFAVRPEVGKHLKGAELLRDLEDYIHHRYGEHGLEVVVYEGHFRGDGEDWFLMPVAKHTYSHRRGYALHGRPAHPDRVERLEQWERR